MLKFTEEEKAVKLKGLKFLSADSDVSFFADNGKTSTTLAIGNKFSWIWEISVLKKESQTTNMAAQEQISCWESEGK